MTRINTLCLAAFAAASINSAHAGDLADFRRDIERQLGPDFIRELPGAQRTYQPRVQQDHQPCAPCEQTPVQAYQSDQVRLRSEYEAHQRAAASSQISSQARPQPAPIERGPALSPEPIAGSDSSETSQAGFGSPYLTEAESSDPSIYVSPEPTSSRPTRSGAHIAPYDTSPATPQLQHSSPTLSLMPNVGTKQSAGRQVWAVMDGDEEFAHSSSPYAPTTHHHGLPVSVRVNPAEAQAYASSHQGSSSEGYVDDLPVGIVQPSIYPPTDAFGNPSLDLRLAASIPANAITASNIDPDRLMQTPVAYHTEGATLAEILRSLVPASYKVSYDVDPGVRDKVYRVTIEKPLAEAIRAVESMAQVHIKPYHKLQVLLVTEHRDALQ